MPKFSKDESQSSFIIVANIVKASYGDVGMARIIIELSIPMLRAQVGNPPVTCCKKGKRMKTIKFHNILSKIIKAMTAKMASLFVALEELVHTYILMYWLDLILILLI